MAGLRTSSDRVIIALEHNLQGEHEVAVWHGTPYPTAWDPPYTGYMTLVGIWPCQTLPAAAYQNRSQAGRTGMGLDTAAAQPTTIISCHSPPLRLRLLPKDWPGAVSPT